MVLLVISHFQNNEIVRKESSSDRFSLGTSTRQGVDGQVEVPFTRWELEEVWDPNPDAQGKMSLGMQPCWGPHRKKGGLWTHQSIVNAARSRSSAVGLFQVPHSCAKILKFMKDSFYFTFLFPFLRYICIYNPIPRI